MKKIVLLALLVAGLCQISYGFDQNKLDNYFDALEKGKCFMGNVAISQKGKIIYTRSVGYADLQAQQPADVNTKYRIGSISKTFTSVLVFKAIEKSKLKLDQTIEDYFPEIKNAGKITVRHLLTHQSGIHNFTEDPNYLTWNTTTYTEEEMMILVAAGGSDFEPGSKSQYSNSNYLLLTFLLQEIFDKSYAELLKEYITEPLGLKNTHFGGKIETKNNEALSYTYVDEWSLSSETDMSVPMGAGAVISTASDLLMFGNALFAGKLVTSQSLAQMKTIHDKYGAGLITVPFYDKTGFGHTGGIDGFRSFLYCFSDGEISVSLVSNGMNNMVIPNDIAVALLSAAYDKPYEIPNTQALSLSKEELQQYAGVYFSQQLQMKITVSVNNTILRAQATGQSSFPLDAVEKNKFVFNAAGIVMIFTPEEKTFLLKQGGAEYVFVKEE